MKELIRKAHAYRFLVIPLYFAGAVFSIILSREVEMEQAVRDHWQMREAAEQEIPARIVSIAARYEGRAYAFGGTGVGTGVTDRGFDCSGFTQQVYREAGFRIPRTSREQYRLLKASEEPLPGDLLFFAIDGDSISHVGIFTGDGKFIHAPKTGDSVRYEELHVDYWRDRYRGARTVR
ncbi:MAG: C40 family peptidase [Leptospiraceae bacterium]|nr:C40 family peptidase [Leptospiraceae bacterium]MCB1315542.1 C40 family peptidase [Leptospiraceae bacterium]